MKRKTQSVKCKVKAQSLKLLVLSFSFALFALRFTLLCYAGSPNKSVKEGNWLYRKSKLDEALQKYNEASVAVPDSDLINFNMGTALYKKADYEKAIDAFTKALTSDNKTIEADALYNLGNCKYKLGKLKENTDLSATVGLLRESLDYYKRAIEIDQKNTDARFNHEFVERELKVLLDKLKQQESNQDKQKEQEQRQEQEKQGTCPAGKEQGEEDKEKNESAQGKEQKQGEKKGQEGQSQQEEKQQKEEQSAVEESQQEEQGKELSEQGARAVLERYGREEALPDYQDRHTRGYDREVLKDW